MRIANHFLLVTMFLGVLLVQTRAARGEEASSPTEYVSQSFKRVGKKVLKRVTASAIRSVCKNESPLCIVVVDAVVDAAEAGLTGDRAALRAALSRFFVDSSVVGFLDAISSGLPRADLPESVRPVFRMALSCLAALALDKPTTKACSFTKSDRNSLAAYVKGKCGTKFAATDCQEISKFIGTGKLSRKTVLSLLAVVASEIGREDVRLYLLELGAFLEVSVDNGLFDPVLAYVQRFPLTTVTAVRDVLEYDPADPPAYALWDPAQDARFDGALKDCGQRPDAFNAWKAARNAGFVGKAREAVINGDFVDVEVLAALGSYQCSRPKKAASAGIVAELRSQVHFLIAPLTIHSATIRYGVAGLAAAMVLDFVRSGDEVRLEQNARRLILYAITRGALSARAREALADEVAGGAPVTALPSYADGSAICEVMLAEVVLGFASVESRRGACHSVVGKKGLSATEMTAIVDLLLSPTTSELEQFAAKWILPAFTQAGAAASIHVDEDVPVEDIARAVTLLVRGDRAAAVKRIARIGVSLLVARLDGALKSLVGESGERCRADVRTTSIFGQMGAACAAYVLIHGAYAPIADQIWEEGISGASADKLAERAYRGLLEEELLDNVPLILNVGLGGNVVIAWDDEGKAFWGDDPYAALTLVDKFGVAFYKRKGRSSTFEFGVFVGGFLDTLIRTVAETGEEHRFWLAGLTAGWPTFEALGVGLELHVAVALPYEWDDAETGFSVGAAVVVPFTDVLED